MRTNTDDLSRVCDPANERLLGHRAMLTDQAPA